MELNIYQSNRLRKKSIGRHLMILTLVFGLAGIGYIQHERNNSYKIEQTFASSSTEVGKEKETTDKKELNLFRSMLFLLQD